MAADAGDERDDWQLLREYASSRSQQSFAQLVQRHVRWVHAVCARQLRDPHLAEDVTQAVFLLLSQRARSIKSGTSITGWLFRAAQLTSANAMKRERRRQRRETRAAATQERSSRQQAAGVASASSRKESELLQMLDAAIASLRQQDRDVILLRFYRDMSVTDAAEELNISVEAAKKRFSRSLDALRKALADRGATLPAAGAAMAVLSAVSASPSQAMPVGLSSWVASGASPAAVSPAAAAIVRNVVTRKLVAVIAAIALFAVAGGSVLAWSHHAQPPIGASTAASPAPAAAAPTSLPAPVDIGLPPGGSRQLRGHTQWVTAAAISPDGHYGVTRSLTELLRWDLTTGQPIGHPLRMTEQPIGVAIAGGGGVVAAIDRSDIVIFDSARALEPRRIARTAGSRGPHWCCALSPDGSTLANGGIDGRIRIYEVKSGREVNAFDAHGGALVTTIAFSPDGARLLTGAKDMAVCLSDVRTGVVLHRFEGHTSMIWGVAFSPDGQTALSFARSSTERGEPGTTTTSSRTAADLFVRVWDLQTGKQRRALPVDVQAIEAVSYSRDGRQILALVAADLITWEASSGNQLARRTLLPPDVAALMANVISPDGGRLLIAGTTQDRKLITQFNLAGAPVTAVASTQPVPKFAVGGHEPTTKGSAP
jgi:RNA polymerase sigma factor (sigma-70 family)